MQKNNEKFPQIVRGQFFELGTDIDIQIMVKSLDQKNAAQKNIEDVKKIYEDFVEIFSRFKTESELSKLNLDIGKFNQASAHMCEIVRKSLVFYKETGGLYDPRILAVLEKSGYADDFKTGTRKLGSEDGNFDFLKHDLADDLKVEEKSVYFGVRMDFSGIAKGYVTDQVAEFLIIQNWKNFLVDSGGDMFMQGNDEEGLKWTVGIEGINEGKLIFEIDRMGIATSGIGRRRWEINSRRIHHIINPKNPNEFSFDLKSVSVVADGATKADIWAKTIFLMGSEIGMKYAKEHGLAVVILSYRGGAWISPEAKKYIQS